MTRPLVALAAVVLALYATAGWAQLATVSEMPLVAGDPERGRLVFAQCRTCHYTVPEQIHGNGPNLYRIFGMVAGKQPGFEYYSVAMASAEFVWTPQLMYAWLENPIAALPDTTMMSAGVPDPGQRADLIAYLQRLSVLGSGD